MKDIITTLAEYLANLIRKSNPEASSFAVLRYALITVLNSLLIILVVILIGAVTGHLLASILAVLAFPTLRYFSGGLHLKSSTICNIISVIIILICVYTPMPYWYNGIVLNIISIVFLMLFSPSGIKQSKIKPQYYKYLKLIALCIVSANFYFQLPVLSLAFFAQSITTMPVLRNGWID